jgi:PKHD-type hydroxylase
LLLHVPKVLTAEQVLQFRRELQHADWIDGRATVGPQGAQVKHNRQLPELSPVGQQLGRLILASLAQNPLYLSAVLPLRTSPPLFNQYEGGEHYGLHIDGAMRAMAGSGHYLRTDVSSTLFLCEPEEYQGGELVIVDTYGTHEVKLPAGDLIVYPATSLHRVEPVTSGTRLCSIFWTQSMIADDGRRSLLFDLDQNIQKLRTRIGDCDEVVALTGHYHNLVRQWAAVG